MADFLDPVDHIDQQSSQGLIAVEHELEPGLVDQPVQPVLPLPPALLLALLAGVAQQHNPEPDLREILHILHIRTSTFCSVLSLRMSSS